MGIFGNDPLNNALSGFSGLFGTDGQSFEGNIINIDVDLIATFKNHPFKVRDNEKMEELVESIRERGIITPTIVRKAPHGTYEMLSGHSRLRAARKIGLKKIPAKVMEMDDDEAIIFVVDANIQREEILPSEKAFAYRMKSEALKRKGMRTDLLPTSERQKYGLEYVGKESGITARQVMRYVRLTYLISPILDKVDRKEISIAIGVEASYLPEEIQEHVAYYLDDGYMLKKEDLTRLKNHPDLETFQEKDTFEVLKGIRKEKEESKDEPIDVPYEEVEGTVYEDAGNVTDPETVPTADTVTEVPPSNADRPPVFTEPYYEEPVQSTVFPPSQPYKAKRPRLVRFVDETIDKYVDSSFSEEEFKKVFIAFLKTWLKMNGK